MSTFVNGPRPGLIRLDTTINPREIIPGVNQLGSEKEARRSHAHQRAAPHARRQSVAHSAMRRPPLAAIVVAIGGKCGAAELIGFQTFAFHFFLHGIQGFLPSGPATINHNGRAGHVSRGLGKHKNQCAFIFIRPCESCERNPLLEPCL